MKTSNQTTDTHRFYLRVYYEDTDAVGIVYYANYLRYAERARTELMRELGVKGSNLFSHSELALVVRRCKVDYVSPAFLDDSLIVETQLQRIGGASIDIIQTIKRCSELLVNINITLGCMSLKGRAARLPTLVREALILYLNPKQSQKN